MDVLGIDTLITMLPLSPFPDHLHQGKASKPRA